MVQREVDRLKIIVEEIRTDISEIRQDIREVRGRLDSMDARISNHLKWTVGSMIVMVGTLVTLMAPVYFMLINLTTKASGQ